MYKLSKGINKSVDKEFMTHMEDMDRKIARAYRLDLEREQGENYSAMMMDTERRTYVRGQEQD